jgi:hypothetical protein
MLSAATAAAIAAAYETKFSPLTRYGKLPSSTDNDFYAFLCARAYPAWFCELLKDVSGSPRAIKECLLKVHAGDLIFKAQPEWSHAHRQQLGQQLLIRLAQDWLLVWGEEQEAALRQRMSEAQTSVVYSLQVDGYRVEAGKLVESNG